MKKLKKLGGPLRYFRAQSRLLKTVHDFDSIKVVHQQFYLILIFKLKIIQFSGFIVSKVGIEFKVTPMTVKI